MWLSYRPEYKGPNYDPITAYNWLSVAYFLAAWELFQSDFYQYSRYLAFTMDMSDNNWSIGYNIQAAHIISVALNIINNALLQSSSKATVASSMNLTFAQTPVIYFIYLLIRLQI